MARAPDPDRASVPTIPPTRYPDLHRAGTLARRASMLAATPCALCPRACGADRAAGARGRCEAGTAPVVGAAYPHFGEEACLVGRGGSGTLFLAGCNLGCVFCQNDDLRAPGARAATTPDALAGMMLALQRAGCANVNLVTPEPHAAAILAALDRAAADGLDVPLVWNTSSYLSAGLLAALDGVVDVYLADFKTADPDRAARWMDAPDYPDVAMAALREMARQVGPLARGPDGLAARGLLVRHLAMPGAEDDAMQVLALLAAALPGTAVNVMAQYRPMGDARRHPPLDRRPDPDAVARLRAQATALGLRPV
jgi:putative pyruvate formate lyase activating enzyme